MEKEKVVKGVLAHSLVHCFPYVKSLTVQLIRPLRFLNVEAKVLLISILVLLYLHAYFGGINSRPCLRAISLQWWKSEMLLERVVEMLLERKVEILLERVVKILCS